MFSLICEIDVGGMLSVKTAYRLTYQPILCKNIYISRQLAEGYELPLLIYEFIAR